MIRPLGLAAALIALCLSPAGAQDTAPAAERIPERIFDWTDRPAQTLRATGMAALRAGTPPERHVKPTRRTPPTDDSGSDLEFGINAEVWTGIVLAF